MYVIKNALANIGRNKGRNLILGAIMLLILFGTTSAILIYNGAGEQIKAYKKQFSTSVIMYRKIDLIKNMSEYQEPGLSDLQSFAKSKLLKSSELISSAPVSLLNGTALDENSSDINGIESENGDDQQKRKPATNMLFGTNNQTINGEFVSGIRKIVQGRVFQAKNEVVISKQLAKLNQWQLNDLIEFTFPSINNSEIQTIKVKIVGIYEDGVRAYESEDVKMALVNRGNEVMTSLETLTSLKGPMVSLRANYQINDPSQITALEKEFHERGLPEYFSLKTDSSNYQKLIGPLQSLQAIASVFLICVLVVGAIVLLIIATLAIKERIYEIGVLRAMGMKKHSLAFGLMIEQIVITTLCLSIAFIGATAASEPIANKIFKNNQTQKTISQTVATNDYANIGGFSNNSKIANAELSLHVTNQVVVEEVIIAIAFAIISSAGCLYSVMRYEPRKILSDRN